MTVWQPETGEQVTEIISSALAQERPLRICGQDTKSGLGSPVDTSDTLSLQALSGIIDYQPEELVMVLKPGTPLVDIELGTLAVMTDITLKVLPCPETSSSLSVQCDTLTAAQAALAAAFCTDTEPSGGAIARTETGWQAVVRLEGVDVSVRDRMRESEGGVECSTW